jgi:guanylate kinase
MKNKLEKSLMLTGAPATGKSTVLRKIVESEGLKLTPDHTTRSPRPEEVPGLDKVFLSVEEFIERFNLGWYLEPDLNFAEYNGDYYGTPIGWINDANQGKEKLAFISVSVEMGRKIKLAVKNNILWVHLVASESDRQSRLSDRGLTNSEMTTRLKGGDSQGTVSDADLMIDTSTVSLEQALRIVKDKLHGR